MERGLPIGSLAPLINVPEWFRGNPIAALQPGRIYIVGFFKTTCAHSLKALCDLGQLQEKYWDVGVEVIGIAVNERAATADEVPAQVNKWSFEKIPNLNIRIAFDNTNAMYKQWMDASWSFNVPRVVVVDRDSKIGFIGRPQTLEYILPKVIDGRWGTSDEAKQIDKERLAKGRS